MQLWLKVCLCIGAGYGSVSLFADENVTPHSVGDAIVASADTISVRPPPGADRNASYEKNVWQVGLENGQAARAEHSDGISVTGKPISGEVVIRRIPSNLRIELGEHPFGEPLHALVKLTNGTETRLSLRTLDPDCGCLDVTPDRREFEPGETMTLTLSLAPAKKLARLRRSIRMLFMESTYPFVLSLDVRVKGPLALKSNRIDIKSPGERFHIYGRKSESGLVLQRWESARGAFQIEREIKQTNAGFDISARPTFSFGNASDMLRLTYRDRSMETHVVDLPVEFYVTNPIRFLPSTVHLTRQEGGWVGRTRMVLSPRPKPIDLKDVKFVAVTESDHVFDPSRLTVAVASVSSVLSMVTFTIDARGESNRPSDSPQNETTATENPRMQTPLVGDSSRHEPAATSTSTFPERLTIRDAANNTLGTLFLSRTEEH